MNARTHARLARNLIAACGGLEEAAGACRLKRSRLSQCCDPGGGAWLTADAIADLEAHCGEPIYSRTLFEAQAATVAARSLVDEACDASEIAALIQSLARRIGKRGPGEAARRRLAADLAELQGHARAMMAALDGDDDDGEDS